MANGLMPQSASHRQTLSWLNKQSFFMASASVKSPCSVSDNNKNEKDDEHSPPNKRRVIDLLSPLSSASTSDNESEQNNERQCTICLGAWRRPVQVPCQQDLTISPHIFCKSCLEKWFNQNRTCPTCRYPVPVDFTPIVLSNEQINQLRIAKDLIPCPNRDKGCQFAAFDLESIDLHESQCLFQVVNCPFAGCSLVVERGKLNNHVESCIYAKATYWSNWLPTSRVDPPLAEKADNRLEKLLKRKWLNEAESHVADLIMLPNHTTAVICFQGQILNLANNPSQSATVLWRSRVHLPKSGLAHGRTQVCHATFDYITNRIYFTICPVESGILWANLTDIESTASLVRNGNNGSVELRPLVTLPTTKRFVCKRAVKDRQFWGVTAIPQLQVVACCHREPNTVGFWSATMEEGDTATSCLISEISFNVDLVSSERPFLPFRCATYVSMTSPGVVTADDTSQRWHITLAVDDIKNSRLHLVGLVIHERQSETVSENRLRFEHKFEQILAWQGVQKGAVNSPDGLHFDPDGKLIVADSGNRRLQIFAATGGIQAEQAELPPSRTLSTRRRSNSDLDRWRCVWSSSKSNKGVGRYDPDAPNWCSMKVNAVVAPLDPKTHRPFILAGLWDDEDVICFT